MELDEYRRMAEVEDTHWWYRSTRALLRQLLADHLPTGGRFLDVGAGTGATGAWLAEHGRLVSLDLEPTALSTHRARHPSDAVVCGSAAALPFADSMFDVVLCVTVLYHASVDGPDVAVREMTRVVRPDGVVCVVEPGVRRLRRAHDRVTHAERRFTRRDLADLLTANGLAVQRSTGAYAFLVPPAALKMLLERGDSASDLDRNRGGLLGLLPALASAERRVLRSLDLPAGLTVVAIGRAIADCGAAVQSG
jgi:ubiquinone/menaquinone biosynthesis C-methylase UbiE